MAQPVGHPQYNPPIQTDAQISLMDLPDELLKLVFSKTDVYTARNQERTCRRFKAITSHNDVWKIFADQLGIITAFDTRQNKAIKEEVRPVYLKSLDTVIKTFPKQLHDHCVELLNLIPSYSSDGDGETARDAEFAMLQEFPVVLSLENKSLSIMYENEEPKRMQHHNFGMTGKCVVFTYLKLPLYDGTLVWMCGHEIKPITDDYAKALAGEIKKMARF